MEPKKSAAVTDEKLSQNVEIGTLCAFYGGLLTERQRTALQLHCDEDWSLAEVADQLGVSRQNVHELIVRSAKKLAHYEKIVGGIAQSRRISTRLQHAAAELKSALPHGETTHIQAALAHIEQIMADINGEE